MDENRKKKLVMVFGTFDHLHAGHENLFIQARKHGNEVIAVIGRDKTVKNLKGFSTDHDEKERAKNLETTGWADKVILGDLKDKMKPVKIYRPDVIALGYDQFAFTYSLNPLLMKLKLDATIVRLTPYRPHIYKSSLIREKLQNKSLELKLENNIIA